MNATKTKTAPSKTASPRYFRIYSTRGNVLADLLLEADAKRFRKQWNEIHGRPGDAKARLVPLVVTEGE